MCIWGLYNIAGLPYERDDRRQSEKKIMPEGIKKRFRGDTESLFGFREKEENIQKISKTEKMFA